MKECPHCSLPAPDNQQFCQECGAVLAAGADLTVETSPGKPLNCRNCGVSIKPSAKFCHECGAPQTNSLAPPAVEQAPLAVPVSATTTTSSARAQIEPVPGGRGDSKSAPLPSPGASTPGTTQTSKAKAAATPTKISARSKKINRRLVLAAAAVVAGVAALGAGVWWFRGIPVSITTDPPQASVTVNGTFVGSSDPDGHLRISRMRRGVNNVHVERQGYLPVDQKFSIGWFMNRAPVLSVSLPPASAALTLSVNSNATEVFIDDVAADIEVGDIDRVVVPQAPLGAHVIEVRRPGYLKWTERLNIEGPMTLQPALQPDFTGEWSGSVRSGGNFQIPLNLAIKHDANSLVVNSVGRNGAQVPMENASAAGAQLEFAFGAMRFSGTLSADGRALSGRVGGETNAAWTAVRAAAPAATTSNPAAAADAEADALVAKARELFEQREYKRALEVCGDALRVSAGHPTAQKLKEQIEQTMTVLGIPR